MSRVAYVYGQNYNGPGPQGGPGPLYSHQHGYQGSASNLVAASLGSSQNSAQYYAGAQGGSQYSQNSQVNPSPYLQYNRDIQSLYKRQKKQLIVDGQVHPYQVKLPRINNQADQRGSQGMGANGSRLLPPLPAAQSQSSSTSGGMMIARSQQLAANTLNATPPAYQPSQQAVLKN